MSQHARITAVGTGSVADSRALDTPSAQSLLEHIDRELAWIADDARSDGWSSQLLLATSAAIALFVFQRLESKPTAATDVLIGYLLFSLVWDLITRVFTWIGKSSISLIDRPAKRAVAAPSLAPMRPAMFLVIGGTLLLLGITWYVVWPKIGSFPAMIIMAVLLADLAARLLMVTVTAVRWYPRIDIIATAYLQPSRIEHVVNTVVLCAMSYSLWHVWNGVDLVRNGALLPAAGLVAIYHLALQLLWRRSAVVNTPALRSLRRDIVLGDLDDASAARRLAEILRGDDLDEIAKPLLAHYDPLMEEGTALAREVLSLAVSISTSKGPLTDEEENARRELLQRTSEFSGRGIAANERTQKILLGSVWRRIRYTFDLRHRTAGAVHLKQRLSLSDEMLAALKSALEALSAAVNARGTLASEEAKS